MKMNAAQKVVVVIWCLLVASVCAYVPWKLSAERLQSATAYSWIWSPPEQWRLRAVVVDIGRVALEIIAVSALAASVFLAAGWLPPTYLRYSLRLCLLALAIILLSIILSILFIYLFFGKEALL